MCTSVEESFKRKLSHQGCSVSHIFFSLKLPPRSLKALDFTLHEIKLCSFSLSLKVGLEIQYSVSPLIHLPLMVSNHSPCHQESLTVLKMAFFTPVILAEVSSGNVIFNFFANVQYIQRCVLFSKVSKGDR